MAAVNQGNGACCPPAPAQPANQQRNYHAITQDYYGKVLKTSKDLKTSACTAAGRPSPTVSSIIAQIPEEVVAKFYGCGAPIPMGIRDLTVLDLGSGSGRDCYVCSALVGQNGKVIGIDMTPEQIQVAQVHTQEFAKRLGHAQTNMDFRLGQIEQLEQAGIADNSIDLIISNCVINLSPDKERVLREAWRVLKMGGELYFSDVYSDRRISEAAKKDEVLWGECISGALYVGDFKRMAAAAGFLDVRMMKSSVIKVPDEFRLLLGPTTFYSITYRLFKIPGLIETACEDYGQIVQYKGTIEGSASVYELDADHHFEVGRPYLVCGNTAAICGEGGHSWLHPHFEVLGNRDVHYGLFGSSSTKYLTGQAASAVPQASCC